LLLAPGLFGHGAPPHGEDPLRRDVPGACRVCIRAADPTAEEPVTAVHAQLGQSQPGRTSRSRADDGSGVPDLALGDPALEDLVEQSGLTRVHFLAWRDLADPEAGGSEVHADKVATAWAAAGLDVTMRTAAASGQRTYGKRNGYSVVRKAGRYSVFPRTAVSGALGRTGPRDGLVEIWNGMPFLSPLWAHCPRIVFLHHVHAEMWRMVLPPHLARVGEAVEFTLAPPFYRRTKIVTLSESSRQEIHELLGMPLSNITVVSPGIDGSYSPGGPKADRPLVVAVGRLVPVKRVDRLIDALLAVKRRVPALEAIVVGEGYEREALEGQIRAAGADDWLTLPGRVSDAELVDLYRRAWVVTSASAREGWGMTITEAAACGTPAVVTDIAGHADAVAAGESGLLVPEPEDLTAALGDVLTDAGLRQRLTDGALAQASRFTWEATARGTFSVLAEEALRRRESRVGARLRRGLGPTRG
jgi:glycosyltransferase involved in cell wall biosynthesis